MPRVDGEFLPAHPAQLLQEGRYNKMDIMTGVTKDEGAAFVKSEYMFSLRFFFRIYVFTGITCVHNTVILHMVP